MSLKTWENSAGSLKEQKQRNSTPEDLRTLFGSGSNTSSVAISSSLQGGGKFYIFCGFACFSRPKISCSKKPASRGLYSIHLFLPSLFFS
jgi:hypothetical protein